MKNLSQHNRAPSSTGSQEGSTDENSEFNGPNSEKSLANGDKSIKQGSYGKVQIHKHSKLS